MSLRAQAAIVGIGELPTRRTYPGRTTVSLMAEVAHLAACARYGLGENRLERIEVRGLALAAATTPFARGRNNTVAVVEILLRRSLLRRLVFDTPVLGLMSIAAKLWYWVWYYLYRGARYRRQILAHPYYGRQWAGIGAPAVSAGSAEADGGAKASRTSISEEVGRGEGASSVPSPSGRRLG